MATMAERLTRAVRLQGAGRFAEAEALYRALVAEAPQQGEFLYPLGLLLHRTGRHLEALEYLQRALAVRGPHPMLHSNLAAVCLAAGALNDAAEHARAAIRLQPGLAVAYFNLGAALRRLDRPEEAEGAFREAVRCGPSDIEARCNLGVVLLQLGRGSEAVAELEEAIQLAPAHAQAHHDLGSVLLATGEHARGVQHLREAVRLNPAFAEAHDNLGLGLRYMDRLDEAVACFREALRLRPALPTARNNLANALEAQGKIDEAVGEFRLTLCHDPHNAFALAALGNLATVGRYAYAESELRAMAERVARADLPLEDRHQLHFALAGACDRDGDHARAFAHYRAGNEARAALERRRGATFDPDVNDRLVDRIIATFTPEYFARVRGFGTDSAVPIFIVGMMRSGTTLAEQILASHPRVHGAGELSVMEAAAGALPARVGSADAYPEALGRLDADTAGAMARECVQRLRAYGPAADRVVDKMPSNFFHLGLIATLLPRARVIHCRRDPVDTCLSCYIQNFGGSIPFSLDLGHLGRYYRAYDRLMAHWARVLPVPVFELRYEALTADQEAVSRKLVAFCGLDWDERCLRFHETERVVRTASVLQVRQPLYQSAVGRWKRYEPFLGPLLEALDIRV